MAKGAAKARAKASTTTGGKKHVAQKAGLQKTNSKGLTVPEQVRQRLRETFRSLSHEEQHVNVQGDPPRTLAEQLTADLEAHTQGNDTIGFGKNYNDKMKTRYKLKSAELQALTYVETHEKTSAAVTSPETSGTAAASTDKEASKETDIAPGLLRAPQNYPSENL